MSETGTSPGTEHPCAHRQCTCSLLLWHYVLPVGCTIQLRKHFNQILLTPLMVLWNVVMTFICDLHLLVNIWCNPPAPAAEEFVFVALSTPIKFRIVWVFFPLFKIFYFLSVRQMFESSGFLLLNQSLCLMLRIPSDKNNQECTLHFALCLSALGNSVGIWLSLESFIQSAAFSFCFTHIPVFVKYKLKMSDK